MRMIKYYISLQLRTYLKCVSKSSRNLYRLITTFMPIAKIRF